MRNRCAPLRYEEERRMKSEERKIENRRNHRTLAHVNLAEQSSADTAVPINVVPKPIRRKSRKILIIGDSHARGCASEISRHVKQDTEVCGIVKPGMCLDAITASAKEEIRQMTKKDVVVIWGGTNDVAKNNTECGQRHLQAFVEQNKQTSIVIMNVPHRHDLNTTSCINDEVIKYNRKLKKWMTVYDHVTIVDPGLDREHFSRHGLHMNYKGKEKAARVISAAIEDKVKLKSNCIILDCKINDRKQEVHKENRQSDSELSVQETHYF